LQDIRVLLATHYNINIFIYINSETYLNKALKTTFEKGAACFEMKIQKCERAIINVEVTH